MTKRIVILHGYTASPDANWFPWLSEVFGPLGVEVTIPALPHPEAPQIGPWIEAAAAAIGTADENLVVVGHSLGCITALHALERLGIEDRLGGLVMVSGFDTPLATIPEVDEFTARIPDLDALAGSVTYRSVITAADDDIVNPGASALLAEHLRASLDTLPAGGHFIDRDGCVTLPIAQQHVAAALGIDAER